MGFVPVPSSTKILRMKWRVALCLISTACLAAVDAGAQDTNENAGQQESDFQDFAELNLEDLLNETVSIAIGRAQTLDQAPSVITVITSEQIHQIGARSLEEVLEIVPGFEVLIDEVGRDRVAVRGIATTGNSENVLILYNGWRLGETVTDLNQEIPVDNIERVAGPRPCDIVS